VKIAFIASAPHTGTWFLIEFLRSLPEVSNFVELPVLRKSKTCVRREVSPGAWEMGLVGQGINLVHSHFQEEDMALIRMMGLSNPTIIPIRDPLASILTRHNRYPKQRHTHMIGHWERMAGSFIKFKDEFQATFVPVDLGANDSAVREASLGAAYSAIVDHGDFRWEPIRAFMERDPWPNSRGDYDLKRAYQDRDRDFLRNQIPMEWVELLRIKPTIQPFLESMGYDDLLWW